MKSTIEKSNLTNKIIEKKLNLFIRLFNTIHIFKILFQF